ncbi:MULTISPECIES: DUF4173 domain-containing protein [Emticicia]|uniref:DUF4153 domain-containing protein n=1 Tax=Emticicia TaxID=312278 RepID=UPI0012E7DFFC|nr:MULTISPECIES: DUF4173 domain-containing protein [Emticicia]
MKKQTIQTASLIGLPLLFNAIFWEEDFGINLFIFSNLVMFVLAFFLFPESIRKRNVQVAVVLTLVSGLMVLVHNSVVSKLGHLASFFLMIGLMQENRSKTLFEAALQYIVNFFTTFIEAPRLLQRASESAFGENKFAKFISRNIFLTIIPMLVFGVFFLIFFNANPVFNELVNNSWKYVISLFNLTFDEASLGRVVFFLFATYLTFSIIFDWGVAKNLLKLFPQNEYITPSEEVAERDVNFQRNEYKIALMLIGSVNVLLLIINVIDINFLWLSFDYSQAGNLSKLVHEGTGTLILSIFLSIAILLYYFRKDLNFYQNNKLLKSLAYTWIVQNVILIISVSLRNYYYIDFYGLTHLRIGVGVFLLITLIGLCTLWLKIKDFKSFFYMFRVNTWALYAVFMGLTLVNWDVLIARYNLSHTFKNGVDYNYLLTLSDKTLPIIYENRAKLPNEGNQDWLIARIERYFKRQEGYTWCSWNFADEAAVEKLKTQIAASPLVPVVSPKTN